MSEFAVDKKIIDKKTLKKAFGEPFERAGYLKKGQSWYLDGKDALIVTNLQKCDWGNSYSMNMGIWIKALGEVSYPQYNHCHMYYGVEVFFPEERELLKLSLDLEKSNAHFLENLGRFLDEKFIPLAWQCTYENNLKEMYSKGMLNNGLIRLEIKWYLESL
jgi:hypothetical protein